MKQQLLFTIVRQRKQSELKTKEVLNFFKPDFRINRKWSDELWR